MATEAEIKSWQTDPDAAYAEAERLIEEAERTSATALDFSRQGIRLSALETLPPQVASLNSLQLLGLDNTQVADLAPLASLNSLQLLGLNDTQVADLAPLASLNSLQLLGLNNTPVADLAPLASLNSLQTLRLNNTQVADLAPLRGLKTLVEGAERFSLFGLDFAGSPATRSDDALRALSEMENPDRTVETLQYLNGDHPVYGGPPIPPDNNLNDNDKSRSAASALKKPLATVSLSDFSFDDLRRIIKMVPFEAEEISAEHPSCEAMAEELAAMAKDLHTDVKDSNAPAALSRALSRYAAEAAKDISDLLPGRLWDLAETFRDAAFDEDVLHAMPPLTDKQLRRLIDKHLDFMRAVMAPTLERMGHLEDLIPAPDANPLDVEKALELGAAVVEENAEGVDQYIATVLRDMGEEIRSSVEHIERVSDPELRESLTRRMWTRAKVAGGTLYRLALRGVQIGNALASVKTLAPEKFDAAIEWLKKVFTDIEWPS